MLLIQLASCAIGHQHQVEQGHVTAKQGEMTAGRRSHVHRRDDRNADDIQAAFRRDFRATFQRGKANSMI